MCFSVLPDTNIDAGHLTLTIIYYIDVIRLLLFFLYIAMTVRQLVSSNMKETETHSSSWTTKVKDKVGFDRPFCYGGILRLQKRKTNLGLQ